MARVTITNQKVVPTGILPAYDAAETDGNAIINTRGDVMVHLKNGSGSPIVVTVQTPASIGGGVPITDYTITVAATSEQMIGPFDQSVHNQNGNQVFLDYDGVASLTLMAFEVPKA
jgi:hypothetical protein